MKVALVVLALALSVGCKSDEPAKSAHNAKEKALDVAQKAADKAKEELAEAEENARKATEEMKAAQQELAGVIGEHTAAKEELGKLRQEVIALRDKATSRTLELDDLAKRAAKDLASATTDNAKAKARAMVEKIEAEKISVSKAMTELEAQIKRIDSALTE